MKKRGVNHWVMPVLLVPFLWLSCDTSDSIDQPDYFVKYYGVEGDQEGVDIIVSSDGSYLLFGNSTLPGKDQQLYLVKTDTRGNVLWEKFFGGAYKDQARDIEMNSDGTLIMAATSESTPGDNNVLLIIVDQEGNKLDSTVYGYPGTDEDVVSVSQVTNGFIATGSTSNVTQKPTNIFSPVNDQRDAFNFRFFNDLTIYPNSWNQTLGPGTYDAGTKVIETGQGQFYFFGYTNKRPNGHSSDNFNFWVFALDDFGEGSFETGQEIFVGAPIVNERLTSVTKSPLQSGEGYFLAGTVSDNSNNSKLFIAKLTTSLNFNEPDQVFQFTPGPLPTSLGTLTDDKTSIFASVFSGFLILSNENNSGNQNFYLTKTSNTGDVAWSNPGEFIYGGGGMDTMGSVAELPDGKIVMVGTFSVGDDLQKKMTLIKVNRDGKFRD